MFGIFYAIIFSMKDKIAISIWNKRISPVMDTATQLLIFIVDNEQKEDFREIVTIPQSNISGRISFILSKKISILICGAISYQFEQALRVSGVEVQSFLGGNVDDIIEAYSDRTFQRDNFLLPGCGKGRRRGRRSRFNRKLIS